MKPVCLIAARKNSKGVPGKNIRLFLKKPLIAHAIRSSIRSKDFQTVIVSTDDKKIANIAKKYGAEVPFIRPKKISSDSASMDDVILHAIQELKSIGYEFDILVNRDCTAPFVKNSDVRGSIQLLRKTKCDSVVAAYKTHLNPYFNMMEFGSKKTLEFSKHKKNIINNRQDAPIVYQLTGFQTINVKKFQKYKKIYMSKILPIEIPAETGLMIDTEFEFKLAECIFKKNIF